MGNHLCAKGGSQPHMEFCLQVLTVSAPGNRKRTGMDIDLQTPTFHLLLLQQPSSSGKRVLSNPDMSIQDSRGLLATIPAATLFPVLHDAHRTSPQDMQGVA